MSILVKPQIAPSLLSADFANLQQDVESVVNAGCEILHLDVMDGIYVPNISFGPMVVKALRRRNDITLEAHLMIAEPDNYIENFVRSGADIVLVHPSTCPSPADSLKRIHDLGAKAGLVVNPDEKLSIIQPYLNEMDQLLIMSVYPGFGGQKFIPEVLDGLPDILSGLEENSILLEIDGGININTISSLGGKGIDRFVAGSAVFNKSSTPEHNYSSLAAQI